MHPRKRFGIGLVLLAAMTFSFVETAAAAWCAPMADMSAAEEMQQMPGMQDSPAQQQPVGDHDREPDERPAGDCPFGPAGATQSCASASLPAAGFALSASPSNAAAELVRSEIEPHIVPASVPFHPPKS